MRRRHVEAALACGVPYPADAYMWRENVVATRPVPPDRFSYAWRQIDKAVDDGPRVACMICVTSTARCLSVPASRYRPCAIASVTRA